MRSLIDRIDDALNPIVVKELRQAVQSRFVVAVLLLFLLLQLLFMGIYLVANGINGQLDSIEFQAGSDVFALLQGVLLTTCMLFIPIYTALRMGAERSDVNVDLLFISTLRPRSIIWGKFVAAAILALLIFSACTPFMTFTYFLRGIDIPSIFFVITLDYVVVLCVVMLAIFLAAVPANRVVKALIGVLGAAVLFIAFILTLTGTLELLRHGLAGLMQGGEFWAIWTTSGLGVLGVAGLFFTWSVALLSPPSANRALPTRLWVAFFWLASGTTLILWSRELGHEGPFLAWLFYMSIVLGLCLVTAISEREHWAPRVARTIPRNWLLRPFAFLLYSGAAGGILFSALLFALTALTVYVGRQTLFTARGTFGSGGATRDIVGQVFNTLAIGFLYAYCYGMTAVFLRSYVFRRLHPGFTWLLFIILVAVGTALPFLLAFLFLQSAWRFETHYLWLLTNPGAGMTAVADWRFHNAEVFFVFIWAWTAIISVLCLPWFVQQLRRFRPFVGSAAAGREAPPAVPAAQSMEATRAIP